MHDALEHAYTAGDQRAARELAERVLAGAASDACVQRARQILRATSPDRFLTLVGALGLGLVACLVYNYIL